MTIVKVHLYTQSRPVEIANVLNAYQKGDMYCVMVKGGRITYKFPLQHIFRVTEEDA